MKTKKKTRAEFLNDLHMVAHDMSRFLEHVDVTEPDQHITLTPILHEGQYMIEAHCHSCGTKYLREQQYYWRTRSDKWIGTYQCPNCCNTKIINDVTDKLSTKKNKVIVKTENGFEFAAFDSFWKVNMNHGRDGDRLSKNTKVYTAGIFDRNSGFYIADCTGSYKVVRKNTSEEAYTVHWLKEFTASNVSDEETKKLLDEGNEFLKKQHEKSDERSAANRAKKEEAARLAAEKRIAEEKERQEKYEAKKRADPRWNYVADEIDLENVFQHPVLSKLYSTTSDGESVYLVGCGKCGKVDLINDVNEDKEYTCPHCGNHVQHLNDYSYGYNDAVYQSAVIFENTAFPENDLLVRIFSYSCSLPTKEGVVKNIYERKRIFMGDQIAIYEKRADDLEFTKDEYHSAQSLSHDVMYLAQTDDQIVEIVKNSCLRYSGLIDSWGLGRCQYQWKVQLPDLTYIEAWYNNPAIETVMKSNLHDITQHLVKNTGDLCGGKTLAEILGIQPGLARIVLKTDPTYRTMRDMRSLYENDSTMTEEVYRHIVNEDLPRSTLKNIASLYHITYADILKYLQSAYDRQCIEKREALSVWSDYLRMASAIGVNLSEKSKKFPRSLKMDHDVTSFAYKTVKIEMDNRAFAEQAEVNAANYEFETDDMIAIVPRSPREVVEEAQAQNNCLRSYIERVKRGETVVAFVRKKSDPEKAFLSAEILDGELVQLKGWCNSDPRTTEIVRFMKAWGKEKNIIIKC